MSFSILSGAKPRTRKGGRVFLWTPHGNSAALHCRTGLLSDTATRYGLAVEVAFFYDAVAEGVEKIAEFVDLGFQFETFVGVPHAETF